MKALKPLIEQLTAMIKEGYDLGKREIPLVGQEILTYALWESILTICVCLFGLVVLGGATAYFVHLALPDPIDRWHDNSGYWIGAVIMGLLSFVPLGILTAGAAQILKVTLAPRVFLLDTLRSYL